MLIPGILCPFEYFAQMLDIMSASQIVPLKTTQQTKKKELI